MADMSREEAAVFFDSILSLAKTGGTKPGGMKSITVHNIPTKYIQYAKEALDDKKRLHELLMQMINNDSVATAKWAHKWADAIDRMNESFAKIGEEADNG